MSTTADTRHWNRTACRNLLWTAVSCVLLTAAAATAKAEAPTGTPGEPASGTVGEAASGTVGAAASETVGERTPGTVVAPTPPVGNNLTFTRLMPVANGQYEFRWNPEEYYGAVIGRLQQYGFSVQRSTSGLFTQAVPSGTRFMLGGSIDEHTCRPIAGASADAVYCGLTITWELFDRTRNTVVYKVTTRSYVQTSRLQLPPEGHAGNLIIGALDSLLRRKLFRTAMSDDGQRETPVIYPFVDAPDLTWQAQREKQAQAEAAVARQSMAELQAGQARWERETLPLRNKRKPYKALGISFTVLGGVSMVTGGVLALTAAFNNSQVEDYREEWMSSVDADELARLKQDTIDTEERRDLQSGLSIGALAFGATSLIVGTVLLAMMPELPPKPAVPRNAKSPLRVRPVIGATELGLRMTF